MAGIAGIARAAPRGVDPAVLYRMASAIRHRGPDGFGWSGASQGEGTLRGNIIDDLIPPLIPEFLI
jgi:asparagine synthetase B (glutamine-hydrolysing)